MRALAFLAGLAALANAAPALACSCMPRSEAQIIASADVVIVGTVTALRQSDPARFGTATATIRVSRTIKGPARKRVRIITAGNSAACGLTFVRGARVRVAATHGPDGLTSNLCMALR